MENNIQEVVTVLRSGGIAIFPTDTAIGIGCRMDNEKAVERIFEIKQRPRENALLVLVDSIEMAHEYVEIPPDVKEKLIDAYWPGGLSIFLHTKKDKVPGIVTSDTAVLAVRWPKHATMERVIREVGVPIIATSANRSGEETPYTIEELDEGVVEQVDTVLIGECTYKKESTIIDTTLSPWKIIRQGVVKIE